MVLSNTAIKKLVTSDNLVKNYREDGLQYSSYIFHIGKIIVPSDGTVLESSDLHKQLNFVRKILQNLSDALSQQPKHGEKNHGCAIKKEKYILKPREIVLFQTAEEVKMPKDVMAIYTSLNSIATKGILLINSSTIEPYYEGPLSGILLNFSNKDFEIFDNMPIAKATFQKIGSVVKKDLQINEKIETTKYTKDLCERSKTNYGRTFLSIKELSSEIEDNLNKKVIRSLSIGGIVLTLLLAFATFQPFLYNYLWSVPSYQVSDRKAHVEYLQLKESEQKRLDYLNNQIDSLKILLNSNPKEQYERKDSQSQRGL